VVDWKKEKTDRTYNRGVGESDSRLNRDVVRGARLHDDRLRSLRLGDNLCRRSKRFYERFA
jgi:hypothetical protein